MTGREESRATEAAQAAPDDSRSSGGDALDQFLYLYNPGVETLINWSEAEVLHKAFLHLHEDDIGPIGEYRLWKYLRTFVMSLGDLRASIKRIVFCYSHEESAPSPPDLCKRTEFYYCELNDVTKNKLEASDFTYPNGTMEKRPRPLPVKPDLARILGSSHWIQPYMLMAQEEKFSLHKLLRNGPGIVDSLANRHGDPRSYQFSILGYEMKPEHELLSSAEQTFLELAYLIHAWTWNHDLSSTHRIRNVVTTALQQGRTEWAAVSQSMANVSKNIESIFSNLQDLVVSSEENLNLIIPLRKARWAAMQYADSLFESPHDRSMWDPKSFPGFLQKAFMQSNKEQQLADFVRSCGWSDAEIEVPQDPKLVTQACGTWLATKLLTRRALDTRTKLSFDQLALSVLFGIDGAGSADLPITVMRTVTQATDSPLQTEDQLLGLLRLRYRPGDKLNWPQTEWEIEPPQAMNEGRFSVFWNRPIEENAPALATFVRSGMLASAPQEQGQEVFAVPNLIDTSRQIVSGEFLKAVYDTARAVVIQHNKRAEGLTKPTRVLIEERTILGARSSPVKRATITFELNGILPRKAITTLGEPGDPVGELGGPLVALSKFFGHPEPIHLLGGEPATSGVFVIARESGSDVLINLEGSSE
jgi:hypothetical protein